MGPSIDKSTKSAKPASGKIDIGSGRTGGIDIDISSGGKKFGFMAESGSSEEDISTAGISIKPPSIDTQSVKKDISIEPSKTTVKKPEIDLKFKASAGTSSDEDDTLASMRSKIAKPGIKNERHTPSPDVDITTLKTDAKIDLPSAKIS